MDWIGCELVETIPGRFRVGRPCVGLEFSLTQSFRTSTWSRPWTRWRRITPLFREVIHSLLNFANARCA
jgi:hypothetical protein